jgi:hypothetical protein
METPIMPSMIFVDIESEGRKSLFARDEVTFEVVDSPNDQSRHAF